MTIQTIANRLHALVEAGDYFTAYDELFHPEAKALEPQLAEMGMGEVTGVTAIKEKVGMLSENIASLNSRELSTPIVTESHIAFTNIVDATMKDGSGFQLSEICLYKVEDGKIISEEFIY